MYDSAKTAATALMIHLRGVRDRFYRSKDGAVLIGCDHEVKSADDARGLPWCSGADLAAPSWEAVKKSAAADTIPRIDGPGAAMLFKADMAASLLNVRKDFKDFDTWPADAQVAIMVLAMSGFGMKAKMAEALFAGRFNEAADHALVDYPQSAATADYVSRLLRTAYVVGNTGQDQAKVWTADLPESVAAFSLPCNPPEGKAPTKKADDGLSTGAKVGLAAAALGVLWLVTR